MNISHAVIVALALPVTLAAQQPLVAHGASTADSATNLFEHLAGRWQCAGGLARGGSLAADLKFTPVVGSHALAFEHVDRPPASYWQHATWSVETATAESFLRELPARPRTTPGAHHCLSRKRGHRSRSRSRPIR